MRADDIVRQRFTKVFRGYDIQEVDLFLDDVIVALDDLERERNRLLSRMSSLIEELERCDQIIYAYEEQETQRKMALPIDAPPKPEEEIEEPTPQYIGGNRLKRVIASAVPAEE